MNSNEDTVHKMQDCWLFLHKMLGVYWSTFGLPFVITWKSLGLKEPQQLSELNEIFLFVSFIDWVELNRIIWELFAPWLKWIRIYAPVCTAFVWKRAECPFNSLISDTHFCLVCLFRSNTHAHTLSDQHCFEDWHEKWPENSFQYMPCINN